MYIRGKKINKSELISILICSRDRHEGLIKNVQKIKGVGYQYPLEIVVVEETDCPNPIDGVLYIHHPIRNRGIPYARNLALKRAKGSIIVFVDDDITPTENWLNNLLAPFKDKDISAVGGAILPDLNCINLIGKCISFLGFPAGGLERHVRSGGKIYETDLISTGNCAFRKDIADKVSGFDNLMRWGGEDQDFFHRIGMISKTVFNPDALVFHTQRSSLKDVFFWFIRRGKADFYRKCKDSNLLSSLIFPLRSNFILKLVLFFLILACALCFSSFTALGLIILTPVVWNLLLWNRGYRVFGKSEFPGNHKNVENVRDTICSKRVKWNLFLVKFMMDLGYETGRIIAFFRYLNHRLFFKPIVLTFHHLNNGEKKAESANSKYYYSAENLVKLITDSRKDDWISVPLSEIVQRLGGNPHSLYFEKIFSITFDDAYESIFQPLLELSSTERIPFMVFLPTAMAGKSNLWDQEKDIEQEGIISWEQAELLRAQGIELGCHTRNHVNLLEVENPTKAEEIKQSYNDLSSRLLGIDKRGLIFSYPHGAYDRETIRLVKEAGFMGTVANFSGNIRPFTDLFQIPRFTVFDNCDWKSITKKARSMWLKEMLKDIRDFLKKDLFLKNKILAISNHRIMLGGGEKSFLDLISHLPEPWEVLAITPGEGELTNLIQQKGIKTKCLDLPSMKPLNIHNVIAGLVNYRNLIRDYKPSLIYANGPRAAFYGGIVGRILKIPVIWHCRIADRDKYLDPLLCRLSNKIVANSNATAKRIMSIFQHKVATVHNGIDIKWMQDKNIERPLLIQTDWKVILVVARLSRWKRHDVALDAFEKIASQNKNLHFVCTGAKDQLEPDWYNYLMQKARQSRYSERIHWIGQVEDVRPWYKSAEVLLLPSDNEPFGRVIVEAMACGVPVIASNNGGVPEIVRDGKEGFLIKPGNADGFANAIQNILSNEALRERLSHAAQKRALDFSLESHVEKMADIFQAVINSR